MSHLADRHADLLAALTAGAGLHSLTQPRLATRLLLACVVLGMIINSPALLVSYNRYHYALSLVFPKNYMEREAFDPRYSPILLGWQNIVYVTTNLWHPERIQDALATAKVKTQNAGATEWSERWGAAEALRRGLSLNVPNLWLVYLHYAGFPLRLILMLVLALIALAGGSGYALWRVLQNVQ